MLEETDVRIAELKKDAYEFKRDIVVGAENFRTGKTMAERVIRYMEEKLRQKDAVIEKLKLKNATLSTQIAKVGAGRNCWAWRHGRRVLGDGCGACWCVRGGGPPRYRLPVWL